MGKSQAQCRLQRISPNVQIHEQRTRGSGETRLTFGGLSTCKSALCPLCAPRLMQVRGEEIQKALQNWGGSRSYFVTFTIRHNRSMRFALLQKLLTTSYGRIWSGRAGERLARALGGPLQPPKSVRKAKPVELNKLVVPDASWKPAKPHSIRAHDRTWSHERAFHPHLHCLFFLHNVVSEEALKELLRARWEACLSATLETFRGLIWRCLVKDIDAGELEELKARCRKVFGKKLFPADRSLKESAKSVRRDLQHLTLEAIMPRDSQNEKLVQAWADHSVHVERVRSAAAAPKYLAKLGCELANMAGKLGRVGSDGIVHFGMWQLANIAGDGSHPLNVPARGAWKELYRATYGTQTLTFSQDARAALGVDAQRDEDIDQEAANPSEDTRMLGEVDGQVWDGLAKAERHALLARLYASHRDGSIAQLPFVETDGMGPAHIFRGIEKPAPEVAPLWWQRWDSERAARERATAPPEPKPERRSYDRMSRDERELFREEVRDRLFDEGIIGPPLSARAEVLEPSGGGRELGAELGAVSHPDDSQKSSATDLGCRPVARSCELPITARKEPAPTVLPGLAPFVKSVMRDGPRAAYRPRKRKP